MYRSNVLRQLNTTILLLGDELRLKGITKLLRLRFLRCSHGFVEVSAEFKGRIRYAVITWPDEYMGLDVYCRLIARAVIALGKRDVKFKPIDEIMHGMLASKCERSRKTAYTKG